MQAQSGLGDESQRSFGANEEPCEVVTSSTLSVIKEKQGSFKKQVALGMAHKSPVPPPQVDPQLPLRLRQVQERTLNLRRLAI